MAGVKKKKHDKMVVSQQLGKTIRYQATCSCGWKSRRRQTSAGAWNEADAHRLKSRDA